MVRNYLLISKKISLMAYLFFLFSVFLIVFFKPINMMKDDTIENITDRKLGKKVINIVHPMTVKIEKMAMFEKKTISLILSAVLLS